ncbi:MAG: hypothetical protein SGCHY_000235 [Lobulomycetales sp.]
MGLSQDDFRRLLNQSRTRKLPPAPAGSATAFVPTAVRKSVAAKSGPALGSLSLDDIKKSLGSSSALTSAEPELKTLDTPAAEKRPVAETVTFESVMAKRIHDLVLDRGKDGGGKSTPRDFSRLSYSFFLAPEDPDIPREILSAPVKESAGFLSAKCAMLTDLVSIFKDIDNRKKAASAADDTLALTAEESFIVGDEDDFDIFADAGRDYEVAPAKETAEGAANKIDFGAKEAVQDAAAKLDFDDSMDMFQEEMGAPCTDRAKEDHAKDEVVEKKDPAKLISMLDDDPELYNTEIVSESDEEFFNGLEAKKSDDNNDTKELSRFHFDTDEEYAAYKRSLKMKKRKAPKGTGKEKQQKKSKHSN